MKKLALLFVLLPLPAFAVPLSDLRLHQASEAESHCTRESLDPESRAFGQCMNQYLGFHYGWRIARGHDGSLHAASRQAPGGYNAAGSIGGSGVNTSPPAQQYMQ